LEFRAGAPELEVVAVYIRPHPQPATQINEIRKSISPSPKGGKPGDDDEGSCDGRLYEKRLENISHQISGSS
jgi:hypothetical protein